ncbi:MAG: hypothetical protein E7242_08675 [Lachnospiraceae bacterium]|nr:hypothetical protein [Lachnospiraceae bacterium]
MKIFKKIIVFLLLFIFITLPLSTNVYAGVWSDGSYGYVDTGVGTDYDVHWGHGEDLAYFIHSAVNGQGTWPYWQMPEQYWHGADFNYWTFNCIKYATIAKNCSHSSGDWNYVADINWNWWNNSQGIDKYYPYVNMEMKH